MMHRRAALKALAALPFAPKALQALVEPSDAEWAQENHLAEPVEQAWEPVGDGVSWEPIDGEVVVMQGKHPGNPDGAVRLCLRVQGGPVILADADVGDMSYWQSLPDRVSVAMAVGCGEYAMLGGMVSHYAIRQPVGEVTEHYMEIDAWRIYDEATCQVARTTRNPRCDVLVCPPYVYRRAR